MKRQKRVFLTTSVLLCVMPSKQLAPAVVVPSGTLSARTGESAKLPVRARLSSFRSLWAVFRGGT